MNREQRILNLEELQAHPDWKEICGDWLHKRLSGHFINELMPGKSVQWCKEKGYTVTPEMIAKTENTTKEKLKELTKGKTSSFVKDRGYSVTPEMIAPKVSSKEILQKAIKELDNMTPEEVQQRSQERGIVIPDEPKEVWTKTMNLRYIIVEKRVLESNSALFGNATITKTVQEKILQQQEINQLGETRWVDVEIFKI